MRIAVVNNFAPFTSGGAEKLADALVTQLGLAGHELQLYRYPLRWSTPQEVRDSMLSALLSGISGVDRVIGLKFPAYLLPHPNKALWLLHQFRQVYDLWSEPDGGDPQGEWSRLRDDIIGVDNACFEQCQAIYTNSHVTANRLQQFNGRPAEILLPPLEDAHRFTPVAYDDYILAHGRVTGGKRQTLIVEAFSHVPPGVNLVVAGQPETDADRDAVNDVIQRHGLSDRVRFLDRYISDDEKADLVNRSLACVYTPVDEDSYGYVTLEAFAASKTVVTTSDSGGVADFIRHEETGMIAAATAEALGNALAALAGNRRHAISLGRAARTQFESLDTTWDVVVRTLTS